MAPCFHSPEIVLLHGMWCSHKTLAPIAGALRMAGYMVHTPTLPLHQTDLPEDQESALGNSSMLDYTSYLKRYIKNLRLSQPPILIGHSMGGLLAQMLASRIKTRAMVLLAPAAPAGINMIHPSSLVGTSFILNQGSFWKRSNRPPRWHADFCLFNQVPAGERGKHHQRLLKESGRCYAEIVFWFLNKNPRTKVDASKVTCPVLVMAGEKDRLIVPAVTRKVSALFADNEFRLLPQHGHMIFDEPGAEQTIEEMMCWIKDAVQRTMPVDAPKRKLAAA